MNSFTLIDGLVIAVIVISAILAYSRGFVREGMAIVGWIVAAMVAFVFAATVRPLVGELPVVGGFLNDSCELGIIAAFALVFAVALVVVSIFTPLLSGAIRDSALGPVDQGAGFLFGVARGVLLVAVALIVYDRAMVTGRIPMVDDSRTAAIFSRSQDRIDGAIPDDAPGWIVLRYEQLVGACAA
ncbi:hypothetical protein OCGS_0764 [Oceaniovalibus guishaninsula JLT2003]|uniref:CvpA family protein n=1 Tax=Oceaniovalibus guishaninsula JLT2003 TaxID=1231392 RepID=K2HQJ7_9RHOB|nr:CvpA family protein [Oceaniovalibus guishaninsula]EKE45069.1 hypothetical protein OCGS_0764 [Oceaniovalibus guishaninsula JLT2003]